LNFTSPPLVLLANDWYSYLLHEKHSSFIEATSVCCNKWSMYVCSFLCTSEEICMAFI
jgi:hypothetical protein